MNIKRYLPVISVIAIAIMLCFALVACGSASDSDKAKFVGDWELESIEDAEMGNIDVAILKQVDMEVTMTLNEDGSADFVMFGQNIDATWKLNNATSMTLTLEGEGDAPFVLVEGKLVSNDGETTMTFVRATAA